MSDLRLPTLTTAKRHLVAAPRRPSALDTDRYGHHRRHSSLEEKIRLQLGNRPRASRVVRLLCLVALLLLATYALRQRATEETVRTAGATVANLLHVRRPHAQPIVKAIWRDVPYARGIVQQRLLLTVEEKQALGVTDVDAAVRGASLEPIDETTFTSHAEPDHTILHIRYHSWDLPLAFEYGHMSRSSTLVNDTQVTYTVTLYRPDLFSSPYLTSSCRYGLDIQCQVPKYFFRTGPADAIAVTLEVAFAGRTIGSFDLSLRRQLLTWSPMSVCSKALHTFPPLSELLEWREHHRMLGFEAVHWSARDPLVADVVKRMNHVVGVYDTFDWVPMYDLTGSGHWADPFYDEGIAVDDCYTRYRYASDVMGVFDFDEWFAPGDDVPWTRSAVDEWRRAFLSSSVATVKVRYRWIDRRRFPALDAAKLSAIAPALSPPAVTALQEITLAGDRYYQSPSPNEWYHYKSMHSTRLVRHAHVHFDTEREAGTESDEEDASLIIFHARTDQGAQKPAQYQDWTPSSSMIEHWHKLADRLRALRYKLQEAEALADKH